MGNWILCLAIIFYSMFAMGETVKTFADSLYQEVLARDLGGSLDEQIKAFKNVIKLDNEYAPAYHKLAQLYLKQNTVISRQRAENAIRNARSIDPENTEYQLTWGEVMWARGFRFNSSEQYKRVLKNNPNNARAAYAVGFRALKEYLKYQDMIDYDQLIDSVVRFEWADFAKKDRQKALAHFSRSISIDPTYASAYHQLALIHYEHQDPQRMLMTCKKLIQHKPEDKNAWLYSGLAFQKMGDQNNAFGCYTRAIKYMSEEERAVMESVSYLIDEADEKEQAALSTDGVSDFSENPQAQEAFWRQQDPLHMTPFNERKMTHYGRVAYANLRFGRPEIGVEGWQTDRGRFYIRYGRWLKKQAQRPELNLTPGGSTLVAHTETWLYEGFSIQFRNWDGLDNWRFNNSKNYAQNYETASAKEFVKQNNARYIDPYRKQKYSVPNLVAAFKQNDSIRIEVAYALPKDRLQISADFQVEMDTGFFLYDTDWKATQQQTKSQIWTYPYSSKTPNSNYAFQKKTLYTSPGTYHLVAEAIDLNRKSIGTFRTQRSFAFPDTGLSMSDLLLASQIRPQNDFPNSREDLDIYPNPLRTYSQSHPVFIYLEIYDLMRNSYGRTHFDIAYRLSLPKSKDIDPTLFESQGLQEGELVITPNFDINGNTQYNVQYKMPKQNQITQNTSRTGQIETSVSAEYEGTKRNDFTYLEIDVGQLPKNIYQLMVMVTDKQANTHVTQHTLFRVVE